MLDFILTHWSALVQVATLAGVVAMFFLKSKFVSIEKYDADRKETELVRRGEHTALTARLDAMEKAILVMAESNKVNDRQDRRLDDLDARIRAVEKHR